MASPPARPSTSRSRYQTPLPFDATTLNPELKKRRRSSTRNGSRNTSRNVSQNRAPSQNDGMLANAYYYSREDSGYDSNGGQAAVETDAWLPYQRPFRSTSRDSQSTPVMNQKPRETSSRRPSTSTRRNSNSSTRPSEPLPRTNFYHAAMEDYRNDVLMDAPDLQDAVISRKSSANTITNQRDLPLQSESGLPPDFSNRGRSSFDCDPSLLPQRNSSSHSYSRGPSMESINRPVISQDFQLPTDPYSPPRTEKRQSRPRTRSKSSWAGRGPRTVHMETVNGVRLDTMPMNPKGNQVGLSLPEIEARDIRYIEDDQPEDHEYAPLHEVASHDRASSPPPIGARHDYVRNIPARSPAVGQDHIFMDNYSRATVQVQGLDALIEQPDEHSRERPNTHTESSASLSEDATQLNSSSSGTYAPSPSIPRTRDSNSNSSHSDMTSKTRHVKDILKGLLKGFVPDRDKYTASRARKGSMNCAQNPVSSGSIRGRDSFESMIQRTITEGERQRANAQVPSRG